MEGLTHSRLHISDSLDNLHAYNSESLQGLSLSVPTKLPEKRHNNNYSGHSSFHLPEMALATNALTITNPWLLFIFLLAWSYSVLG